MVNVGQIWSYQFGTALGGFFQLMYPTHKYFSAQTTVPLSTDLTVSEDFIRVRVKGAFTGVLNAIRGELYLKSLTVPNW